MNYDVGIGEIIAVLSKKWEDARWDNRPEAADAYRKAIAELTNGLSYDVEFDDETITVDCVNLEDLPAVVKGMRRSGWHWSREEHDFAYVECCNNETCRCITHDPIMIIRRKKQ